MPKYTGEPDFQHGTPDRIGVLITNLGSPDLANTKSVRRYLAEFLMDPRVVEVPRLLWWLILHGVILRFRPRRSARAYQKIWTDAGSPLIEISRQQADGIRKRLHGQFGDQVVVTLAMRYGQPSIANALEHLNRQNVRKLLVLPLYPQYSAVTVASTFDAVASVFKSKRWIPELRMINQYHDEDGYVDALANSVQAFWKTNGRGERLLMSFHGIPKRYLINGDPYYCQSHKTARLLADKLQLSDDQWTLAFQSRLGREEWLQPYTADVVAKWGAAGAGRIDTICPGFSADCLETLEEIVMQYGEEFVAHGGGELRYIPCLNAGDEHLNFLTALATRHLQPWLDGNGIASRDEMLLSRERALQSGATK